MIPSVSASSVRRTIVSVGLHRRKAQKVVYLTKTQKRARKQWALRYKGWKERDWGTVIWSDECYVYLGDDRGTVWVTRTAEEEFDENWVIPTFKQSAIQVMVWGCVMKGKKGPLVVLEYPGG
jgi:hypothetical protein